MDRTIGGRPSARYLWEVKGIVPFLKVDKGLEAESGGVQLMKPIPGLEALLGRARTNAVFGTKMRSVVRLADDEGVASVVSQQFTIAEEILASGLVPIIEPEVAIDSPHKAAAETLLKDALLAGLERLGGHGKVMFKLTLPEEPGFYRVLVDHPGGPEGGGAVGGLHPRGSQPAPGAESRCRRELFPAPSPRASTPPRAPPSSMPCSILPSPASSRPP